MQERRRPSTLQDRSSGATGAGTCVKHSRGSTRTGTGSSPRRTCRRRKRSNSFLGRKGGAGTDALRAPPFCCRLPFPPRPHPPGAPPRGVRRLRQPLPPPPLPPLAPARARARSRRACSQGCTGRAGRRRAGRIRWEVPPPRACWAGGPIIGVPLQPRHGGGRRRGGGPGPRLGVPRHRGGAGIAGHGMGWAAPLDPFTSSSGGRGGAGAGGLFGCEGAAGPAAAGARLTDMRQGGRDVSLRPLLGWWGRGKRPLGSFAAGRGGREVRHPGPRRHRPPGWRTRRLPPREERRMPAAQKRAGKESGRAAGRSKKGLPAPPLCWGGEGVTLCEPGSGAVAGERRHRAALPRPGDGGFAHEAAAEG